MTIFVLLHLVECYQKNKETDLLIYEIQTVNNFFDLEWEFKYHNILVK